MGKSVLPTQRLVVCSLRQQCLLTPPSPARRRPARRRLARRRLARRRPEPRKDRHQMREPYVESNSPYLWSRRRTPVDFNVTYRFRRQSCPSIQHHAFRPMVAIPSPVLVFFFLGLVHLQNAFHVIFKSRRLVRHPECLGSLITGVGLYLDFS
jgi:hypothetical protein